MSIAILDNCSVHHVNEVLDLFHQAGILVLFLPPYSPHLNLCEEAFSFIKSYLRRHDELLQVLPSPLDVIKSAFNNITEDCADLGLAIVDTIDCTIIIHDNDSDNRVKK